MTTYSAQSIQGLAITTVITALFGLFWGFTGTAGLPPPLDFIGLLGVFVVTLGLFAVGFVFRRRANRFPSVDNEATVNPFRTRAYKISVALMVIAFPIAGFVLRSNGFPDVLVSVIAIIVGLHFFGLIRAFDSRKFAIVGGALCLLGVLSLGVPASVSFGTGDFIALRQTVVGVGCALILWGSLLGTALPTWRETNETSDNQLNSELSD